MAARLKTLPATTDLPILTVPGPIFQARPVTLPKRRLTWELVEFARHQGYRADELVEIIESVG